MKREDIEKAGKIYIENLLDYHIDYTIINNEEDNYEAGRNHALYEFGADIFKAGAEWMEKNLWISVDDGYPPFEKEFPLSKRKLYFVRAINGSICQEVVYTVAKLIHDSRFSCEMDWVSVTHWMPIPSFDEILEANRDVLERIKEKGD